MRTRIKEARARIEPLRLALVSLAAEDLGAALPGLEEAVFCLGAVERELREGAVAPYEVRRDLQLLKNELRIVTRLIEHGMTFCRGWARMLGAVPAYTQTGGTVAAPRAGTLSIEG